MFNGSGWYPGHLIQAAYTSRGEVVTDTSGSGTPSLYANGTRIQTARSSDPTAKTATFAFNAFQGMTVVTQSASQCAQGTCTSSTWGYANDSVGRQTTAHFSGDSADYINARSYDAEDHLLVQTLPWIAYAKSGVQRSLGYRWGPVGHPLQVGSTSAVSSFSAPPSDFQYDTLIWDDDDLLFTMNSAGQIDDLKVADFADYVPGASNPLTVWDRDTNGQIYGCHTSSGASSVPSSAFQQAQISCGAPASFISPQFASNRTPVGRGGMLLIPKPDGFSDGQNTFQGVRTYDPQAGTWTTPDAYHGDVHDPMSQKPYMWNRNDPYDYSDPSGLRWNTTLKYSPQERMIDYMRKNSPTFDIIYNTLARSKRTYNVDFAAEYGGTELGGFFLPESGTIMLHPFGKFSNNVDSDLAGMIDRFAHEIGHAFDYEMNGGHVHTDWPAPPDNNPHDANNYAEWYASQIHDIIMEELERNGYSSLQFAGQHGFGELPPYVFPR